jgi:SAM-dependent methyltransferase
VEAGGPDQGLEQMLAEHAKGVWAVSVLAAVLESGLLEAIGRGEGAGDAARSAGLDPAIAVGMLDVLASMGLAEPDGDGFRLAAGLAESAAGERLEVLRADLRTTLLQSREFLAAAREGSLAPGWSSTDPELLEAQGLLSAMPVPMLAQRLLPSLGDLGERLAGPDAAMLDVGAGVARVSIAFARQFPALRVVGLEPADAPLAIARRNVAAAGLEDRIELRRQLVQDMEDEGAFDLAWLPIVFLPDEVVESGLRTVLRALRPGGYVTIGVVAAPGPDLGSALWRLRARLWGSEGMTRGDAERMVREAGYDDIRVLPARPGGALTPIAARRPPD